MIKKNITINFCGRLYAIDEDAYELLKHYTESIRRYFSKVEGGDEIASDIESRIAELFDEQKDMGVNAITIELTENIIHRIGELDDIAPKDDTNESNTSEQETKTETGSKADEFVSSVKNSANSAWDTMKSGKRYYRDTQNKIISGVLAGCAQYFGGSPLTWRICFLLIFFICYSVFDISIFPIIIFYIIMTIIAPAAQSPEEVLQMKGEQVTPQNLADEVTRQNNAKPGVFHEMLSVIGKIILIIICGWFILSLIGVLSATAIFLTEPLTWFYTWFNLEQLDNEAIKSVFEAVRIPFYICCGASIILLFSLAYCSIHALTSSFGKTASMGFKQRMAWLLIVIACFVASLAAGFKAVANATPICKQWIDDREEQAEKEWAKTHTVGSYTFAYDCDMNYFKREDMNIVKAENCFNGELTSTGEYYNGDEDYRYINVYSPDRDIIFQAEREVNPEAGKYNVSCLARSSKDSYGVFLFVTVDKDNYHKKHLVSFPDFGNLGQQIYKDGTYAIPDISKETNLERVIAANDNNGYGWAYLTIKGIEIPSGATVRYGVSTDPEFTDKTCRVEWFSACDFKIEKQ